MTVELSRRSLKTSLTLRGWGLYHLLPMINSPQFSQPLPSNSGEQDASSFHYVQESSDLRAGSFPRLMSPFSWAFLEDLVTPNLGLGLQCFPQFFLLPDL